MLGLIIAVVAVALGIRTLLVAPSNGCQTTAWNAVPAEGALPSGWSIAASDFTPTGVTSTLSGPTASDGSGAPTTVYTTISCFGDETPGSPAQPDGRGRGGPVGQHGGPAPPPARTVHVRRDAPPWPPAEAPSRTTRGTPCAPPVGLAPLAGVIRWRQPRDELTRKDAIWSGEPSRGCRWGRATVNFVLVHGAYHGAWCWDLIRPELERAGHTVTAVDLPITDPGSAGAEYAQTVIDGTDWAQPQIVVAHSMGGLIAPLVAAERPVARLVFLAAFLPKPGMSANDQRRVEQLDPPFAPTVSEWTDLGDDTWTVGPMTATELFFHDVPADVTRWAVGRLRPQCYRVMNEITPLQRWPDVPSTYIVCRDDHGINPEWGRMAARGRLGVEPIEIDGGHSPMLSRPGELARVLGSLDVPGSRQA